VWALKGERPTQLFAPTRKKLGYFGAVDLDTGEMKYQRADNLNAQTFKDFLKRFIGIHFQTRRKVIMILDNARWHHAKLLNDFLEKHKDRLELLFLPPYSPECNPQERVWKLTRRKATHNKYFNNEQDLAIAVESQFFSWNRPNDELWNLCAIKYVV
jgi:transposase